MKRRSELLGAVILLVVGACTTFDGETAQQPGADGAVSAPASFLSQDQAARACGWIFRCPMVGPSIVSSLSVPVRAVNFSVCMDWLAGPIPSNRHGISAQSGILQCVANATTCAEALACLPWEELAQDDPRCTDADGGSEKIGCIDNGLSVLRCDWGEVIHCDSANYAPGSRCLMGTDGQVACALAKNCTDIHESCSDTTLDICSLKSGLHEAENCAIGGRICAKDPKANATACLTDTTLRLCPSFGADCDGVSVAACDGYSLSIFDCASMGATCSKQSGDALCKKNDATCTPMDAAVNVCSGNSISLCVGGKPVSFDCTRIGASCKAETAGLTARCE